MIRSTSGDTTYLASSYGELSLLIEEHDGDYSGLTYEELRVMYGEGRWDLQGERHFGLSRLREILRMENHKYLFSEVPHHYDNGLYTVIVEIGSRVKRDFRSWSSRPDYRGAEALLFLSDRFHNYSGEGVRRFRVPREILDEVNAVAVDRVGYQLSSTAEGCTLWDDVRRRWDDATSPSRLTISFRQNNTTAEVKWGQVALGSFKLDVEALHLLWRFCARYGDPRTAPVCLYVTQNNGTLIRQFDGWYARSCPPNCVFTIDLPVIRFRSGRGEGPL